jgi:flagellar basal-body rod protein FlgF
MDNTLYVGLSRQKTLQREVDVVANNIANADTAGFKVESLMVQTDPRTPPGAASTGSPLGPINFVYDVGVARDFSQGALRQTGGSLDIGLQGDGFFQVTTAQGNRFTRDGRFSMDAQGRIVTADGDAVQSDGGGELTLDPLKGQPTIARDGTVSQQGLTVGKVGVFDFSDRSALQKSGAGLYENVSNLQPQADTTSVVMQGMVESSNVNPIAQMTRLIEVSRAYEQIANLTSQTGDLADQAIQRLGKVN